MPTARSLAFALFVWAAVLSLNAGVSGQTPDRPAAPARSGANVYRAACAACHGIDGTGAPQALVGFDTPLPDFTDCAFATPEPDPDWLAVTHGGGPARAFDRRMPAFGEALSEEEMQGAVDHLRTFCSDARWPRGELNLPRALVTEKAFPENEAVLTVGAGGGSGLTNEFLYERRLGPRSQFEVAVPFVWRDSPAEDAARGLGDVAVAVKHALYHSLDRGAILSVAGEVVFPTGKETLALGKGVTIFEPFVAYGQILPRNAFVQLQAGAELPADADKAGNEAFWRAAAGLSIEPTRFGRVWSPIIEVLGARELEEGEPVQWDVLPQMQVTLSTRQHIMINVGVRVPVTDRAQRSAQFLTYLLWDWFDGGLRDGW